MIGSQISYIYNYGYAVINNERPNMLYNYVVTNITQHDFIDSVTHNPSLMEGINMADIL